MDREPRAAADVFLLDVTEAVLIEWDLERGQMTSTHWSPGRGPWEQARELPLTGCQATNRPRTPPHTGRQAEVFRQFQYPTVPLYLTAEDARKALERAGWFTGQEVRL